jgi:ferredoxin
VKIRVDDAVCEGYGTCAVHAPDLFVLDEWGYASVAGDGSVPAELEDNAKRAIADCPMNAIHEVRGEGV